MTRRGGWPMAVLLAHSLVVQVVTFVLRPTTTYRAIELDVAAAWLGALSACFAVAPLLLALPAGAVVDRVGERRVVLTGAVLLVLSSLVLGVLGSSVTALVLGTVVLGVGHLCSVVGQQTFVANYRSPGQTTPRRYDAAFGHYTFAASLGQALGPLVIATRGGPGDLPDTGPIFSAALVASVLVLLLSLLFRSSRGPAPAGGTPGGGLVSLVRLPGLARALVTSCVILAAVDVTLVYLPALGAERGISAAAIGVLLTLRAVSSMVSRLFLGRLSAAVGRRRLLVVSTVAAALAVAATAATTSMWALVPLVCLAGLGLGVGQPVTMAWLASSAPAGQRGRAMSLRLVGNRAGQVAIPTAAGALAAGAGAAGVLLATGAALAVVGVAARSLPLDTRPDP